MTYEEFEWNILKLVYEDGLERLQPSYLAYALGLPHETVSSYLEHAVHTGVLEMDVTDDGRLEYFIPGMESDKALPRPAWKDEFESAEADEPAESSGDQSSAMVKIDSHARSAEPAGDADGAVGGEPIVRPEPESGADEPTDGSVHDQKRRRALVKHRPKRSQLPAALRSHIEERYGGEDGSVTAMAHPSGVAVVSKNAKPDNDVVVEGQLVKAEEPQANQDTRLAPRIETEMETFTDPSQTIFMRQLKVYGVQSEQALREHVERLFGSFGYQAVQTSGERMRFERGSVTFILALVPLFVLVLPLFVYLFLYCMGRSTIQQEPVELDVQFRKLGDENGTYEIDLTFIGMHGVVLGAADQRVLNQEVDTLRDELQWALSTG